MISFEDYEEICHDCRSCQFSKDCAEAGIIDKRGRVVFRVFVLDPEDRYENLVKYWRKQKLSKLLEK